MCRKSDAFIILLVFFLKLSFFTSAQNSPPVFHHLTVKDGLSHDRTTFIFQDKRGFLWIGTLDGLNRFDGKSFKTYFHSDTDSNSIADNNISEITEDASGNLLVGHSKGFSKYAFSQNRFINFELPVSINTTDKGITSILFDNRHHFWASSRFEVFEFDSAFNYIRKFNKELAGGEVIFHISEDVDKNLWIEKSGVINMLSNSDNRIYNLNNNPHNKQIFKDTLSSGFVFDAAGNIWGIKKNKELVNYAPDGDLKNRISLPSDVYAERIFITPDEKILITDPGKGVLLFEPSKNKFTTFFYTPDKKSINAYDVAHVMEDNDGNIWFATENGVAFLQQLHSNFNVLLDSNKLLRGEKTNYPFEHFIIDSNRMWINVWAKGIYSFDLHSGKIDLYKIDKTNKDNFSWELLKVRNELWTGNFHGLHRFNQLTHQFTDFKKNLTYPNWLDSTGVVKFFMDKDSNIWFSLFGANGILKYDLKSEVFTHYNLQSTGNLFFPLRHFDGIAQDNRGRIWMGYGRSEGLVLYDSLNHQFNIVMKNGKNIFSHNVECLLADGDFLWIGSVSGLYKMNLENYELKKYSRNDGLVNNYVHALELDAEHKLWIATDGGLSVLEPATGWITNFTDDDGLPENSIRYIHYRKESRCMYFLAEHFVFTANVDNISMKHPNLVPCITSFTVMGNEKSFDHDAGINLDYTDDYFSFEMAAPLFPSSEKNQYAYKLDGFDKEWVIAGNRRFAGYTSLPYGNYLFRLKASPDGVHWNEMKKPVHVHIKAPFYLTRWFMAISVLAGIILVFAVVSFYYRMKLKRLLLVQEVRNKIASDLHDDIGSTLSSISYMSEIAKQKNSQAETETWFNMIGESSRSIIENMNDIVWSVNPQHDTFESLLVRMRKFASSILEARNINLTFDADDGLERKKLGMDERKNLFLIFKEIINNSAKHSSCKNVKVKLSDEKGKIRLFISDDGKGFDMGQNYNGNGLKNLYKRAADINAELKINSSTDKGSEFNLYL